MSTRIFCLIVLSTTIFFPGCNNPNVDDTPDLVIGKSNLHFLITSIEEYENELGTLPFEPNGRLSIDKIVDADNGFGRLNLYARKELPRKASQTDFVFSSNMAKHFGRSDKSFILATSKPGMFERGDGKEYVLVLVSRGQVFYFLAESENFCIWSNVFKLSSDNNVLYDENNDRMLSSLFLPFD